MLHCYSEVQLEQDKFADPFHSIQKVSLIIEEKKVSLLIA